MQEHQAASAFAIVVPAFPTTVRSRERALAAQDGRLTLQVCRDCGRAQYPSGDVCRHCLSGELAWSVKRGTGKVLATAVVHASLDPSFRERGPWRICSVLLDTGPRVIAFAADAAITAGDAVEVHDRHIDPERCILMAARSADTEEARGPR
jgi:uncharacterized OB-fold protein